MSESLKFVKPFFEAEVTRDNGYSPTFIEYTKLLIESAERGERYKQALEDIRRILDLYPHIDYSKSVTRRRLFDLANEALEGESE